MNGWNHKLPKMSAIRCSRKSEHVLPHMWLPSWFTKINWKPVICHSGWTTPSTYVTQCQICEQGVQSSVTFPWGISLLYIIPRCAHLTYAQITCYCFNLTCYHRFINNSILHWLTLMKCCYKCNGMTQLHDPGDWYWLLYCVHWPFS